MNFSIRSLVGASRPPAAPCFRDLAEGIDDATEALRWCKKRLQQRETSEVLRMAQSNLAYLAMALDWQMEGESAKATRALQRLWRYPHKEEPALVFEKPESGC